AVRPRQRGIAGHLDREPGDHRSVEQRARAGVGEARAGDLGPEVAQEPAVDLELVGEAERGRGVPGSLEVAGLGSKRIRQVDGLEIDEEAAAVALEIEITNSTLERRPAGDEIASLRRARLDGRVVDPGE